MRARTINPLLLGVWAGYGAVVLCVAVGIAVAAFTAESQPDWSSLGWTPPNYRAPLWAIAVWFAGIAALVAVPWRPLVALCSYVALAYGITRYDAEYEFMLHLRVLDWLCALSAVGFGLWMAMHKPRPDIVRRPIVWIMLAFVGWLALCSAVAVAQGRPWNPLIEHHPAMYLEGMALMIIAACALRQPRDVWIFAAVLGVALSLRATLGAQSIWRDGDIAAMLVIAIPLTVLAALSVEHKAGRIAFVLLTLNLLRLLIGTQNRAAAVAFAAAIMVVWLQSRRKALWAGIAVPVSLVGLLVFMQTQFWDRFRDIWTGGSEQTSAFQRLEIWRGGVEMFAAHPVFGVGTGNYANYIQQYEPQLGSDFVAHNNFINLLAEAGIVGLLLYVALFGVAIVMLIRVAMLFRDEWPAVASRYVITAIVAYLVVGMFITRPDLGLAYLLVGWSMALSDKMRGPVETPISAKTWQPVPSPHPQAPPRQPRPWPQQHPADPSRARG